MVIYSSFLSLFVYFSSKELELFYWLAIFLFFLIAFTGEPLFIFLYWFYWPATLINLSLFIYCSLFTSSGLPLRCWRLDYMALYILIYLSLFISCISLPYLWDAASWFIFIWWCKIDEMANVTVNSCKQINTFALQWFVCLLLFLFCKTMPSLLFNAPTSICSNLRLNAPHLNYFPSSQS